MGNVLYDALFEKHQNNDNPFLYLQDGGLLTYSEFIALSGRLAHVLQDAHVEPGDRVAVQVQKSPQALALYAACVRAGAVFLPLNTAYTPKEVEYFVTDAEPKLVVCDEKAADGLSVIAEKNSAQLLTLNADGSGSLMDASLRTSEAFDAVTRKENDLAAILYTSGTTGRSKGAMLSHKNLLSNAESLIDYWRFTDKDVLLHGLPIFHTHGLFVATNVSLLAGASMIFLPGFDKKAMLENLPKATTMMGVPTFYTRLLESEEFTRDLVSHMRLFISGSAPLLAETHVAFEERTGHRILERYGMTETNMNTSNPYDGERRAGTVGFPLPGVEVRVTDAENGNILGTNEIGILEVKGNNVFQGYWRMPEKTAEELREDGFFITGDMGKIDEEGYVHIVGREKDLIISGGYNVYPKEIELVVDELPGVQESAVVGVPHPDFGEGVIAVVVPDGTKDIGEESVLAAISEGGQLARFKQPKKVYFLEELPRNTMGKVQKNALREDYKETFKAD